MIRLLHLGHRPGRPALPAGMAGATSTARAVDRSGEIKERLEDARSRREAAQSRREWVAGIALGFVRESHQNHFVERLQRLHDDERGRQLTRQRNEAGGTG